MTDQPARPSEVLAAQVSTWRERRKLSAQALANRIADLGGTLNRAAISRIENGDRGVSLDEWLQLAHALAVPPPLLFCDLESGNPVQIAPEVVLSAWSAWQWVTGEMPPSVGDNVIRVEEFTRAQTAIRLYRDEASAARAVQTSDEDIALATYAGNEERLKARREYRANALHDLANILNLMIENDISPPALPREWIDAMRSFKRLRYADRIPVLDEVGDDGA